MSLLSANNVGVVRKLVFDGGGNPWKYYYGNSGRQPGQGSNKHGADGRDLIIKVPPGTLIYDTDLNLLLKDLSEAGLKVCLCRGGKGGKGNSLEQVFAVLYKDKTCSEAVQDLLSRDQKEELLFSV